MPSRLIVVANAPSNIEAKNITDAIKNAGAGWWHWYPHIWMIVDFAGRDAVAWRKLLAEHRTCEFLVLSADDGTWTGVSDRKHYDWLYENWFPYKPG